MGYRHHKNPSGSHKKASDGGCGNDGKLLKDSKELSFTVQALPAWAPVTDMLDTRLQGAEHRLELLSRSSVESFAPPGTALPALELLWGDGFYLQMENFS